MACISETQFCFILFHVLKQSVLSTMQTNAGHPIDMVKGTRIKLYYSVLGEIRYYEERENCT